jgi:hypothetical protein
MTERGDAMLNGALMGLGTLAILDNVVVHWLLGLHREVPGQMPSPLSGSSSPSGQCSSALVRGVNGVHGGIVVPARASRLDTHL